MAFTHTIGSNYNSDSGRVIGVTSAKTGDAEVAIDVAVPSSSTNYEIDLALTQANIKSAMIYASVAATVKTNSTSSPQETISLAAGQALVWNTSHPEALFISGNLTKFYVTCTLACTFKFRALLDQTPA